MGHHSKLIGGGKGEGGLFCSDAHKIVASIVNVLTRIVLIQHLFKQLINFSLNSRFKMDAPVKIVMQPKYGNSAMNQGQICNRT